MELLYNLSVNSKLYLPGVLVQFGLDVQSWQDNWSSKLNGSGSADSVIAGDCGILLPSGFSQTQLSDIALPLRFEL